MLKNYIKVAIRTFRKNKIFTVVSLFGISFTLMVIMLTMAYADTDLGHHPPMTNKDRIVGVTTLEMLKWRRKTNSIIDSVEVNGVMNFDTTKTETIDESDYSSSSNSYMGEHFIQDHLLDFETPLISSMYSNNHITNILVGNEFIDFNACYSDDKFFKILDYVFLEGRPYDENEVINKLPVIVLTKSAAQKYFGSKDSYIGEVVFYQDYSFKVVGVIEDIATTMWQADFFMPYTFMSSSDLNDLDNYFGNLLVLWLLESPDDKTRLAAELRNLEAQFKDRIPYNFDVLRIKAKDINNLYAEELFWNQDQNDYWKLQGIFMAFIILFILVPVMNLMNLNINRMLDRSAEIGVRKAFGASTSQLISQFVVENLLLTTVGGLLGLVLTFIAIAWINQTNILGNLKLMFFPNLFISAFFLIVFFGVLSGFYPAWKAAKVSIAQSLKSK